MQVQIKNPGDLDFHSVKEKFINQLDENIHRRATKRHLDK